MKKIPWNVISEFEGPERSPGFLLWQVSSVWRRSIESTLKKINLTHTQFVLLANLGWLTKDNSKVTQVILSKQCKTDINMTSQVLRLLEKKGLIKRTQQAEDARSKLLKLTLKGAKVVEKAIPLVEKADKDFFKKLGSNTSEYIKMLKSLL